MGAHLWQESWAQYGQEKPRIPCPICGVHATVGQKMEDPSQVSGCPVFLIPGSVKGVFKPGHQCKLLDGAGIDYSIKSAETSTLTTPCTNRPVKCQHCTQVVPSYYMAAHYEDKHSTTTMPEDLRNLVAVGKHECAHTKLLLHKRKLTASDNVCKGPTCCAKRRRAE